MPQLTKKEWALSQKFAEESSQELITRLNTKLELPNPEKQKQVLATVDLKEVRKAVTDEEAFAVLNSNLWALTLTALRANDLDNVKSNIAALVAGKALSAASAKKLQELLGKTIPDPSYNEKIYLSPCQAAGFDLIYLEDIV
jgi:hypothetical protein